MVMFNSIGGIHRSCTHIFSQAPHTSNKTHHPPRTSKSCSQSRIPLPMFSRHDLLRKLYVLLIAPLFWSTIFLHVQQSCVQRNGSICYLPNCIPLAINVNSKAMKFSVTTILSPKNDWFCLHEWVR